MEKKMKTFNFMNIEGILEKENKSESQNQLWYTVKIYSSSLLGKPCDNKIQLTLRLDFRVIILSLISSCSVNIAHHKSSQGLPQGISKYLYKKEYGGPQQRMEGENEPQILGVHLSDRALASYAQNSG